MLSPHSASFNEDTSLGPGIEWASASLIVALKGNVPNNVFNREVIPRWKEKFGGASVLADARFQVVDTLQQALTRTSEAKGH